MIVVNKNPRFSGRIRHDFNNLGGTDRVAGLSNVDSDAEAQPTNEQIVEAFSPQKGQTIVGIVTRITNEKVYLDLGMKSEGIIPIEEFSIRGFGHVPEIGDKISVAVVGDNRVSFVMRAQRDCVEALSEYYKSGKPVNGIILGPVKSGFAVWLFPNREFAGRAFLPLSQMDPQVASNRNLLEKYMKEEHPYYIVRIDNNLHVVVSRKSEEVSKTS